MAQKSLYQLTLDINANSAKLSQGLAKANSSLGGTGKAASGLGKIMNNVFKEAAGYIDNMIPGFSSFTSGIKKMITGVNGFSGSLKIMKTALISTGIGAIVVAFGSLISYFKNTKAGADVFNKALGGIKAVITTLMKRINLLGEAVSLVLKGKFKEAAEKAKEAFSDFGDEVSKNYALGRELAERENALKKRQIEFIRKQADMERDIAEARLIASDKSKTEGERQKAIAKAIQLQKDLGAEKNAIAEEEYKVQSAINALGDNKYTDDEKEAELYAKMVGTQKEEADRLREMVAMQNEIATQAKTKAAAEEKALEALKAQNQAIEVQVGPIVKPLDTKTLAPMQMGEIEPPNFESTTTAWQDLWETIHDFGGRIYLEMDALKDQTFSLGEALYSSVANAMSGLVGTLADGANSFKEYASNLKAATKSIIGDLISQAVASMVAGALKDWATKVPFGYLLAPAAAALAGGLAKTAFNSMIPGFATGTSFAPGGLALVGERGPELVNLPRGAQVYNNNLTRGMMGGGEVRFIIEQDKLVGILGDYNKKNIYF